MRVSDIADHRLVTIPKTASLLDAARLMREQRARELVLVEATATARIPVGVITERDIVLAIAAGAVDLQSIQVGSLSSRELISADADEDLESVVKMMIEQGVRRMPVVNSLGALVGIVTYDDVVSKLAAELAGLARELGK
jgi:CBS domain-containing protein